MCGKDDILGYIMEIIRSHLRATAAWLVRFIQLQLFITLISLPILISWGVPLSLLSPLGNLIFSPLLTIFLSVSSLIFFAQLCHLPHAWLVWVLEKITNLWLTCMHADSATWLMGFAQPSKIFLILFPLIILVMMIYQRTASTAINIVCLLTFGAGAMGYLHYKARNNTTAISTLACNKGDITILRTKTQELIVIDPGYIGQRASAASWMNYTLLPHLIKTSGSTMIDHLIVLQPSSTLFQALELVCTKVGIKKIYIIGWQQDESSKIGRAYMRFKRMATAKQIKLVRIGHRQSSIELKKLGDSITITPLQEQLAGSGCSFPALCISACIDNQKVTIYSARCSSHQNNTSDSQNKISHP